MADRSVAENISFSYETLGGSSYLVATLNEGFSPVNYQMEMLSANEIPNILSANKHQKDADVKIYYNATSKISLAQAISRQKMSKQQFLNLITGAVNAFKEVNDYQLVNTGIVLDPELIFVNSASFDPAFVYLPVYTYDEGITRLKDLIVNMVLKDTIEVSSDNFVQILLSRINVEPISLTDIDGLISELRMPSAVHNAASGSSQAAATAMPGQPLTPVPPNHPISGAVPGSIPEIKIDSQVSIPSIPNGNPVKGKKKKKPTTKEPKPETSSAPGSKKFIMIGIQVLFVIVYVGLLSSSVVKNEAGGLDITKALGLLIAIGGIDYVIYREMFVNAEKGKSAEAKPNVAPKTPNVQMPDKKGAAIPKFKPAPPIAPAPSVTPAQQPIPQQPVQLPVEPPIQVAAAPISNPAEFVDSDDTMMLSDYSANTAYLEYCENGISNKIPLNKPSVIVGRLQGQADYIVNNNKIGRVHAEFITRDGCCFVKDHNSMNGTYINGNPQRINSNTEHLLHNNDRIILADTEFILRC